VSGLVRGRYLCDDCGREVFPTVPGPCICGSTVRRRIDPADAFGRPKTVPAPVWDPLKDWATKYLQFTWNVGQLRRLSAPGSATDADEVRRIVHSTFAAALGLADWLTSGPEPASVSPGDVARLVAGTPLSVCAALVRPDGVASARLVPVGFARPPRFWVEYRRPPGKPIRYDALDLAGRCLVAWQHFLTARAVTLPSWG
jgi:hypothetical protein